MENEKCCVCGKTPLTRNEIGLVKRLIGRRSTEFYCFSCLSKHLDVTEEELNAKIEEFKEEGCSFFD